MGDLQRIDELTEGCAEHLARQLFNLRAQIEVFKRKAGEVEEALVDAMTDKKLDVDGIVFERKQKKDRKQWQHAELQSALIAKVRASLPHEHIDPATGEIVEEDDIARTARVFTATANPAWRVGALKAIDIDADEFCSVTPAGYSIIIHDELGDDDA